MFTSREIVWAKVKGYPWWPAQIYKLPASDNNYFKVSFIGQNNHAFLDIKSIRKYQQYYEQLKQKKCKGLQPSIQLADKQLQQIDIQQKVSEEPSVKNTASIKQKKIKRKNKRKLKSKKMMKSESADKLLHLNAPHFQNLSKRLSAELKNKNSQILLEEDVNEHSAPNQASNQSQSLQQSQISSEIALFNLNVDRKKIQSIEQQLFLFISKFNEENYDDHRKCYEYCLNLELQNCHKQEEVHLENSCQEKQLKINVLQPQQVVQSKITNMLSYIFFKLKSTKESSLSAKELGILQKLIENIKKSVIKYLKDPFYYHQYLKIMEKHVNNQYQTEKTDFNLPKKVNITKRKYYRKNKFKQQLSLQSNQ